MCFFSPSGPGVGLGKDPTRECELLLGQSPATVPEYLHMGHFVFTNWLIFYLISDYLCDSGPAFSPVLQRYDSFHTPLTLESGVLPLFVAIWALWWFKKVRLFI